MEEHNHNINLSSIYPSIFTFLLLLVSNEDVKNLICTFTNFLFVKICKFDNISLLILVNIIGIFLILQKVKIEINIKYSLK